MQQIQNKLHLLDKEIHQLNLQDNSNLKDKQLDLFQKLDNNNQ